ncbi:MAG: ATP-binding protein [Archangium gephyra]|uniref:ATP-binding protein n=1 Tax=Archangium gephyra TaxID=48 RepID=A0A2W5TN30_9BACT|nr:MAG: ATP-binding protein [Archangium gephyra]
MANTPGEAEVIELPVPRAPAAKKARARRVIAIGGGKGGIGKSLLSANLGIALSKRGAKVVLADLDLGGANLHTCLGVPQPKVSLSDFVERRVNTLDEVLVPTPHENLKLLSGAMDGLDAANPKHSQKTKLLRNLRNLDVDYVLLDLGAGTTFNVLDFFLVADTGVVVMLPEPTSIENAYRFIKAAFFRRLQALAPEDDFATLVGQALAPREGQLARTPWDVVASLRQTDAAKATRLEQALGGFRPLVIVNQARTRGDFDVGPTVASAWKKFFGLELGYLGAVAHDDAVWQAVRARRSLLDSFPESAAASGVLRVAENLIALER